MDGVVSLSCTEIPPSGRGPNCDDVPQTLEVFRSLSAYVLLGDPGSGKTTAFKAECAALGEEACLVTARNFLALDLKSHPEWRDKTLFIDGLDEVRAESRNLSQPFDKVRRRLDALGKPNFRISCRVADWLGNNDRMHLEIVSPDSQVKVLYLNPLSESDIIEILNCRLGEDRAPDFVATARERGVDGLLANPQSLTMLATVVDRGRGWPGSRLETFESACQQLVREHNEEHRNARWESPPKLMGEAGRMCALQLISGAAGYTSNPDGEDQDYPSLDQFDGSELQRSVLATKVYTAESDNRFAPIHRHIAEFLGGRYLAQLVEAGLPASRVISLIAGDDGLVVTEMRGLSAWFAAHSTTARAHLIEIDPIGVGLYGDIRTFSLSERRSLLTALSREGTRLDSVWRTAAVFGALVTPDMEPELRRILTDSNRDPDHQILTDFVARILSQNVTSPDLSGILLRIVRDSERWPRVRTAALDAFIGSLESEDKTSKLKALLSDIQAGNVVDPDSELLGRLLAKLYPDDLPPSAVWDYLSEEGTPDLIGRCLVFWDRDLLEKSSDEEVAELLDNLEKRILGLWPALEARHLDGLPSKLLSSGLESHGDALGKERLYNWLSVGTSSTLHRRDRWYGEESLRRIRSWLERRPELQKAVILEGLDRCPDSDEFRLHAFEVQERLYGSNLPSDFGTWCLNEALANVQGKPRVAEHLLELACLAYRQQVGNEGLSFELLKEHAEKNSLLNASLSRLIPLESIQSSQAEADSRTSQYAAEERKQEQQWRDQVRSHELDLRQNQATPGLLFGLAKQYFGHSFDRDGPKAIEERLQGDKHLTNSALEGLRGAIDRPDVPSVKEILRSHSGSRRYLLAMPFLAGLAEIERTDQVDPSQWHEDQIRKALAFYFCTPHAGYVPEWYRRLLETRAHLVADVQVEFAISEFRRSREGVYNLWNLAHDPEHAEIARLASLALLRTFPNRCSLKQIKSLDYLLWAALQHADAGAFRSLIDRKLSRRTMNVAQRVRWLAVAAVVFPGEYDDRLGDFVEGHKRRSQFLAEFFSPEDRVRFSFSDLDSCFLKLLIRLIGRHFGPDEWGSGSGWVTPAMKSSDLVRNLIQQLANLATKSAGVALAELVSDEALASWHGLLSHMQRTQDVIRRDAGFSHPNIALVCRTLNNDGPANSADLAALLTDRLHEIDERIRTGNSDDWRPYWNEDSYGQPASPKHENSCRDAILFHLRSALPSEVDVQPEGHYANDTRADIRVSCQDFQVPIEIKKNEHRDLWTACKDQLIEQYTIDPATGGFGIYLVLWFGEDRTQAPPFGKLPSDPQALKNQLRATLSDGESRKISVCVVDLSRDRS